MGQAWSGCWRRDRGDTWRRQSTANAKNANASQKRRKSNNDEASTRASKEGASGQVSKRANKQISKQASKGKQASKRTNDAYLEKGEVEGLDV